MNKHFEDARYYLGRAAEHAAEGVREELEPVEKRVRAFVGAEKAPASRRIERVQSELRDVEQLASGRSAEAIRRAREQLQEYRSGEGDSEPVELEIETPEEADEEQSGTADDNS